MPSRGQLKNVSASLRRALCLSSCPPVHPLRRQRFPFFPCENPKIKQAEPFVPFKSSQRNSFYNHAIRYFQSHQFAEHCFSNNALVFDTMAGNRERAAEWDCLDDVEIVTWHLHLLDLRTAAPQTAWWMAVCACRWSSCLQSAPANVVLLLENWDGFHLLYVHLFCDLEHMVQQGVQLFNLASDDSGYYVAQILLHPKRVPLNINSVILTKFHRICADHVRKYDEISVASCQSPLLLKNYTFL